jgi:hypothetical protein
MRNRLVMFLILLMIALPVWSAATVCCHVQKVAQHHCCEHMQMEKQHCHHLSVTADKHISVADNCHCDQLQHSQFMLSLPEIVVMTPASHFIPPALPFQRLPERADILYRPPIA